MQIISFPLNAAISHPVQVTGTVVWQAESKSAASTSPFWWEQRVCRELLQPWTVLWGCGKSYRKLFLHEGASSTFHPSQTSLFCKKLAFNRMTKEEERRWKGDYICYETEDQVTCTE